jgi:hypothetical protein
LIKLVLACVGFVAKDDVTNEKDEVLQAGIQD